MAIHNGGTAVDALARARDTTLRRIQDEKESHENLFRQLTESRNTIDRCEQEVKELNVAIHQLQGTHPIPDRPQA